jgi:hypothetical protein
MIVGSVAIVICLALAAGVIFLGNPSYINGGGGLSIGRTGVQYLWSGNKIVLVIWTDNTGASESNSESSLTSSRASGFFSLPDGRRIVWEWNNPKHKGGDFQIDGTPFDLANGALLLVSTKGGKVRVTQLDVDLSKVQFKSTREAEEAFRGFAENEPRVAKFIAGASQQK